MNFLRGTDSRDDRCRTSTVSKNRIKTILVKGEVGIPYKYDFRKKERSGTRSEVIDGRKELPSYTDYCIFDTLGKKSQI